MRCSLFPSATLPAFLLTYVLTALAHGEVLAQDDFQKGLNSQWRWLRVTPADWCIREGGLEVRNRPGNAQSVRNALLRSAPERDSRKQAIEVTVRHLHPLTEQYEQAGITLYGNEEPVFKFVKELVDGQLMMIPGRKPMEEAKVRLRLIVDRDSFVAQYQPGATGPFLMAAQGELPAPAKDAISLQCYHGPAEDEHWVRFEDFRVYEIAD